LAVLYATAGKARVHNIEALRALLSADDRFYVYLLCYPPDAPAVRPFYVGIGQGERLFAHEREAADPTIVSAKARAIRDIQAAGRDVVRYIDGLFDATPWHREQELISRFGLVKSGTGSLTNEQEYAGSFHADGVELRKYATEGNAFPSNFLKRNTRLRVGPNVPRNPRSVYGKICAVLESNPRVTGAELVELLLLVDFSDNKTVYSHNGQVSRPWLAKYIDGGFYVKNCYIQDDSGATD
jgi:hypothetical protein